MYYIGFATTAYLLYRFIRLVVNFACPSILGRASDGIGLGFAHELCARGFNVILHGRNETKLQGVQARLEEAYSQRRVRLYVADAIASTSCDDFVQSLGTDMRLTVLINNVGGWHALPQPFNALETLTPAQVTNVIGLNAGFTTRLTAALLPLLLRQPGPALVLNVSSITRIGIPFVNVYAGTKGYLISFSEALHEELRMAGRNVDVRCVEVGSVETDHHFAERIDNPGPRTFARAALDRVGKGDTTHYGYWVHAVQAEAVKAMPMFLRRWVINSAMRKTMDGWKKDG